MDAETIIKEALALRPKQKAKLVDKLLSSLNGSGEELDGIWADEGEARIEAFENGKLKAVSLEDVLSKYR